MHGVHFLQRSGTLIRNFIVRVETIRSFGNARALFIAVSNIEERERERESGNFLVRKVFACLSSVIETSMRLVSVLRNFARNFVA